MEATGNYGMLLLYMLSKGGYKVSMINPKQIKPFAMMMTVTVYSGETGFFVILGASKQFQIII